MSVTSLTTHQRACMPSMGKRFAAATRELVRRPLEGFEASPIVARIQAVESVGWEFLEECRRKSDGRNASAIMGQLLRCSELLGKVNGELIDRREKAEITHKGAVLLVPAVSAPAQGRRVLAAPEDGELVNPDVAQAATTLDAIEAEIVPPAPETAKIGRFSLKPGS